MQLVIATQDRSEEVDLDVRRPTATIGDLLSALNLPVDAELYLDARILRPETPMSEAGLYEGAILGVDEPADKPHQPGHDVALVVLNSFDAGLTVPLTPGLTIGRDPQNGVALSHGTVSRHHCRIERSLDARITITDESSRNGVWVADKRLEPGVAHQITPGTVFEVGDVALVVRDQARADRPDATDVSRHEGLSGTIPFNRPPPFIPTHETPELEVPVSPTPQSRSPFSIAGTVAPLAMAGVMIAVTHNIGFAVFALMSPVVAIGSWYEMKRRGSKGSRRDEQQFTKDLTAFADQIIDARASELTHRRAMLTDPSELVRRATLPSARLWERRGDHPSFLSCFLGTGAVAWTQPVRQVRDLDERVKAVLDRSRLLYSCPVSARLASGGVVGIVGARDAALAVARGLVLQVSVAQGPADVRVAIFTQDDHSDDWDWAKWLPHTRNLDGPRSSRWLGSGEEQCDAMLKSLLGSVGPVVSCLVIDNGALTKKRTSPARTLLQGSGPPVAGIVIAPDAAQLPAACDTVITLQGIGDTATLNRPQLGEPPLPFIAAGISETLARRAARSMARLEDPELKLTGAGLPERVSLIDLLGFDEISPPRVLERWGRAKGLDLGLPAPLGVSEEGAFAIELVSDGPHGLVGGTTGSGKSELLRSFIAGIAATVDPDHATFVLVDYKGGAAFAQCSLFPHTVGMVTDLDAHLGERALRCLEAELKYRERALAGYDNMGAYIKKGAQPLIPRLLVVVDEFATLREELPEFMSALVGVAQRGRSLGVHMILATQRPSGAVSEDIKANTNVRIALRVQDSADSVDVIGVPSAAAINRAQIGRAFVRLGPGEIVPIQTALASGVTDLEHHVSIQVVPFGFGPVLMSMTLGPNTDQGETDLERLVTASQRAFESTGRPFPRRPWPEPLPDSIDLDWLTAQSSTSGGETLPLALADDPEAQSQYPVGWDMSDGNILAYGIPGSGIRETLETIGLCLAQRFSPDDLHLYVLDSGTGSFDKLSGLGHIGEIIPANDSERQSRLIGYLRGELRRRRGLEAGSDNSLPRIVLLFDNYGAFSSERQSTTAGLDLLDSFARVYSDGPGVGIFTVLTADRAGAVPSVLGSLTPQKWIFRLADPSDFAIFGLNAKDLPTFVPGRAVVSSTKQVVQVARCNDVEATLSHIGGLYGTPSRPPVRIGTLPKTLDTTEIGLASIDGDPWMIPIGIAERDLLPAVIPLFEGEHVLIAGPARSGKSTALCLVAAMLSQTHDVTVVALASKRSPLCESPFIDELVTDTTELCAYINKLDNGSATCVLIDDADSVDDTSTSLASLLEGKRPSLHVFIAGRPDSLRSAFGHWTQVIRRSKLGILLRPNLTYDGDLLAAQLPSKVETEMSPGRGFLVTSEGATLMQMAQPTVE